MSSYLRPRRGKKSTAEAQLTQANPLKRGEVFFEVPDTGVGTGTGKIKMGDGSSAYADLPYFLDNSGGGGGGGIGEDIHITLTTGSWNAETISGETYYVQNASAAGATSSTVPVIVPIYTTDTEMENYSYIIRVEPYTNILKFIATAAPTVNLNVVAKFAVESTADLDVITEAIGVDITQEDYDQLTPEEKNSGVYWITNSVDRAITVDTELNSTSPNVIQNAAVATAIGNLSSLTTTVKSNLVGAVNELNQHLTELSGKRQIIGFQMVSISSTVNGWDVNKYVKLTLPSGTVSSVPLLNGIKLYDVAPCSVTNVRISGSYLYADLYNCGLANFCVLYLK